MHSPTYWWGLVLQVQLHQYRPFNIIKDMSFTKILQDVLGVYFTFCYERFCSNRTEQNKINKECILQVMNLNSSKAALWLIRFAW